MDVQYIKLFWYRHNNLKLCIISKWMSLSNNFINKLNKQSMYICICADFMLYVLCYKCVTKIKNLFWFDFKMALSNCKNSEKWKTLISGISRITWIHHSRLRITEFVPEFFWKNFMYSRLIWFILHVLHKKRSPSFSLPTEQMSKR